MEWLAPVPVILPLLMAALLAAIGGLLPRRLVDLLAGGAVAGALAAAVALARTTALHGPLVYWFGGWRPGTVARAGGFPVGVSFVIGPLGASAAAVASLLMLAALVFSWAWFEQVKAFFHTLMLVFLAAMCGLALTGDLFNLFVWFELMTAAGVTLCGYKARDPASLQGGLNFAVANTIGAFLTLIGIALVYAFTGALNMAAAGEALRDHPPAHALAAVAFAFLASGFLVKAAIAPFHFWLADAHAAAPSPVSVLFSGIMVELGLLAVWRIYWALFADCPAFPPGAFQHLLLFAGALTALWGALMCYGQHHFKRLLAFSTVSHVGLITLGLALATPKATAGAALYVLGHGCVKGGLFLCSGILLHRFGTVDEMELRGKGRWAPAAGVLMILGALGLAGVTPFATGWGAAMIDEAAHDSGQPWIKLIFIFCGAVTAGAVLRAAVRIYWNLGPHVEATARRAPHIPEHKETRGHEGATPLTMIAPAALLLLVAIGLPFWPGIRQGALDAAAAMQHSANYRDVVLHGAPLVMVSLSDSGHSGLATAAVTFALALFFAAAGVSRLLRGSLGTALARVLDALRLLQSGRIGDYVAWFLAGIAAYGGLLWWF